MKDTKNYVFQCLLLESILNFKIYFQIISAGIFRNLGEGSFYDAPFKCAVSGAVLVLGAGVGAFNNKCGSVLMAIFRLLLTPRLNGRTPQSSPGLPGAPGAPRGTPGALGSTRGPITHGDEPAGQAKGPWIPKSPRGCAG